MKKKFNKIVCVGLPKTGTTTLGEALQILGFSKAGYDIEFIEQVAFEGEYELLEKLAQFEVFEDWPYPLIYKDIYKMDSDAAFILTKRVDSKTWIKSIQKHTARNRGERSRLLRQAIFGHVDPVKAEQEYVRFYEKHNQEVEAFFEDKEFQFASLCWETGGNWEGLCSFLGVELPSVEFPHANSASSREKALYRINRKLKQLAGKAKRIRGGGA